MSDAEEVESNNTIWGGNDAVKSPHKVEYKSFIRRKLSGFLTD